MQAMINLYETFSEALHTIQELEAAKIVPSDISLIIKNGKTSAIELALEEDKAAKKKKKKDSKSPEPEPPPADDEPIDYDLKAKFFSDIHVHELSGIGAIAGGGWMVKDSIERTASDDIGISSGTPTGLIECMVDTGLSREHAETYVEGLKRGATLIAVRAMPDLQKAALRIMREEHRPLDPHMRGHHYWTNQYEYKDDRAAKSNRILAMLISGSSR